MHRNHQSGPPTHAGSAGRPIWENTGETRNRMRGICPNKGSNNRGNNVRGNRGSHRDNRVPDRSQRDIHRGSSSLNNQRGSFGGNMKQPRGGTAMNQRGMAGRGSTRGRGSTSRGRGKGRGGYVSEELKHAVEEAQKPKGAYTGLSDDILDAAYLNTGQSTRLTAQDGFKIPQRMLPGRPLNNETNRLNDKLSLPIDFGTGYDASRNSTQSNEQSNRLETPHYLSDVEHCQSKQPVLVTHRSCLYPPRDTDILEDAVRPPYVNDSKTIIISNLPSVVDEVVLKEIFDQFGEIETIKLEQRIADERLTKFCELRFKESGAAFQSLRYDKHYIFIGREGTLMLPLMVARIHMDVIDLLPDDYTVFTQATVSETMSSLLSPDRFASAAKTVQSWLRHGECNKSNFNTFFALASTANGFLEQIRICGEDLKNFVQSNREEEARRAVSVKEKCVSMKSLFDACRADYVTRVFSPDQKEAISNYSNNVYKEIDLIYLLLERISSTEYVKTFDKVKEDKEHAAIVLAKEEEDRKRLEEMEKVVKENSDLKSRLVSMDIDRNELLWAIKQVEKKPKEHKEILEQKDRQIECLSKQLEGLKQCMKYGQRTEPHQTILPEAREYRRSKERDHRESRWDKLDGNDSATTSLATEAPMDIREKNSRQSQCGRQGIRRQQEVANDIEASVIKQEVILDEDEEISFTVVDELREDSQGSQENSQKGSKVTDDARVTVNHSRSNSNDDRKRDTFGLVEYSDDHTSIVKVNDTEATVSENLPAQCFGTSERTCKRKPEGGSEQQVRDNDVNSLRDITSISKVGQSILKRLKLGSSLNKPEQAHEVGSLEKSSGEPREELIVASEDNDKRISFEPQEEEMKPNAEIVKHENFVACNESNEDEGVSGREAILCSILTIAINAYPAGATTNDLVNYCDSNKFRVKRTLIENTLYKYPNLFCRIKSEDDVERWSFNGFHTFKDYGQSH